MTAPDLTNLTADELRRIAIGDGTTADDPYAAVDELHRRAQANALVQAERDEFDEELHTCRAIVGATSEHLHVDLEELVDKLRRTEADSRSWQELATARAQANDALREAARNVLDEADQGILCHASKRALREALAAAPAAQPTPAAPVTDDDAPGGDDGVEPGAPIAHLTCPGCKGALEIVHGDEVGAVSAMWVLDGDTRLTVGRYTAESPTPAAPVTRDAACAAISALRTADQRQDWTASREAQDKLVEMLTRTPAAPVNDADVEAAITELIGAHRIDAAVRAREADGVVFPPGFVAAKAGALRNLIARRVASAGAAPVDSEREAAIDQAIRHHWNCARSHARGDTSPQCVNDCLKADERLRALMRSAPPQGRGDDGMRLAGLDLFSLRDSLAADRPAPAGDQDAKLMELRAWVRSTWKKNAATGKGGWWSNDAKEIAAEIDRLLAAPAASKGGA